MLPVTAIAFAPLRPLHSPLVLAAEASYLRIFCLDPPRLLLTQPIFSDQPIHGISCTTSSGSNASTEGLVECLLWGGRRLALASLSITLAHNSLSATCSAIQYGRAVNDYILDACLLPVSSLLSDVSLPCARVLVVTADNVLFLLNLRQAAVHSAPTDAEPYAVSYGPSCALYSAHIKHIDPDNVLVAAGTVFGGIHVWHASVVKNLLGQSGVTASRLVQSYPGHEGSVFGVRWLDLAGHFSCEVAVASCSDDRSIKLWAAPFINGTCDPLDKNDVCEEGTGFAKPTTNSGLLLTSAIGHLSRIWSVRNYKSRELLVSFGEDATAQIWGIDASPSQQIVDRQMNLLPKHSLNYHSGKNIWAGEVYSDGLNLLATGGADGRIAISNLDHLDRRYTWCSESGYSPLNSLPEQVEPAEAASGRGTFPSEKRSRSLEVFKSYSWLADDKLIATTSLGRIQVGSLRPDFNATCLDGTTQNNPNSHLNLAWATVGRFDDLSSLAIVSSVPGQFALLTGSNGNVHIYLESLNAVSPFLSFSRKVAFLHAATTHPSSQPIIEQDLAALVACIGMKCAYFLYFDIESVSNQTHLRNRLQTVSLPTGFVVTSASFISAHLLILGSRYGALAFYNVAGSVPQSEVAPVLVLRDVHGQESVTSIVQLPARNNILFATTGRDGCYAVHQAAQDNGSPFRVRTFHRCTLPFGPHIEGISFRESTQDLLVWGFRNRYFVMWNVTKQQELASIECGGSSRAWSYILHISKMGGSSFVWTQASNCHIVFQPEASHNILQTGSHGREIRAVAVRPGQNDGLGCLIATGAEDTTVRICKSIEKFATCEQPIDCLAVLRKHTTGIQKLLWSRDGLYLFSAAGKEEFHIWRAQSIPCVNIGIVHVGACRLISEDGDLRIMDFDVEKQASSDDPQSSYLIAMGYSDSSIRLWRFEPDSTSQKLHCLAHAYYSTVCVTQCRLVRLSSELQIITCATDGHIALWRLNCRKGSNGSIDIQRFDVSAETPLRPLFTDDSGDSTMAKPRNLTSYAIHQSSIKSMALARISEHSVLIATGGDDNAIGISIITRLADSPVSNIACHVTRLLIPRAHAAAISALALVQDTKKRNSKPMESQTCPDRKESASNSSSFLLASAGNDQRVKRWTIQLGISPNPPKSNHASAKIKPLDAESISITKAGNVCSSVADVGDMDLIMPLQGSSEHKVAIGGVGFEVWSLIGQ